MRTSRLLSIGAVFTLLMLTLVACLGNDEPTPSPRRTLNVLDNAVGLSETQQITNMTAAYNSTQAMQQTINAYETLVAPPTQAPIQQRSPQPSPTNTDAPENDLLGNIVYPGKWLTQPFTTTDDEEMTLSDFEGKIVVLLPMSLGCQPCEEQLGFVRDTDQRFRTDQAPYEVVYLNLDVSPLDTIDDLKEWVGGQNFATTGQFQWVTGKASPELIAALNSAFGGSALNIQRTPILIVDSKGQGHNAGSEGMLDNSRLRDVIVFYSDQGKPEETTTGGSETELTEEAVTETVAETATEAATQEP